MTRTQARAALLEHIGADNGDRPAEWCDIHRAYVGAGVAQPVRAVRSERLGAALVDEGRARVAAAETYCPTCHYLVSLHVKGRCPSEAQARHATGDR